MDLELVLQRLPSSVPARTPGELFLNGIFFCYTVEDQVREILGMPVERWKIPGATAIPAGRYWLTLEKSVLFGPDTITINGVEGFEGIRIHGGNDEEDSKGCPIVGYLLTPERTVVGGLSRPALANLKRNIKAAIEGGGRCFIDVRNPAAA